MKVHPETKIAIGLILAFMLVVAGSVCTYLNSAKAIESGKAVNNGLELLAILDSLNEVLIMADRRSTEYIESGDPKKLAEFRSAVTIAKSHVEFIKSLVSANQHRRNQIVDLQVRLNDLIKSATDLVQLKESGKENGIAIDDFRKKQQSSLDYVRGRIILIDSETRSQIAKSNRVYEDETKNLFVTYLALGLIGLVFLFGLVIALTKYISSERRVANAQQKIVQEIVAHAPIGVLILDEALNVVSCNPTFIVYLGEGATTTPIGKRLTEVITTLPDATLAALTKLQQGEAFNWSDLSLKESIIKPGRVWDVAIWPVKDNTKLAGFVLIILDVTESVEIINQRQLLFNTFAHDLKNPLIGNQFLFQELFKDDYAQLSDTNRSILDDLKQGNEDALKMIMDILEICRLDNEKDRFPIQGEQLDLRDLLDECISELRPLSNMRSLEVKCDFPKSNAFISSDRSAVKHLVLNLLDNAIKFSDEKEAIEILLREDSEQFVCSVINKGQTISEQDMNNLFRTIGQGELGRRVPGGAGIGMYLSARLSKMLGGSLRCESNEKSGTAFIATLPKEIHSSKTDRTISQPSIVV